MYQHLSPFEQPRYAQKHFQQFEHTDVLEDFLAQDEAKTGFFGNRSGNLAESHKNKASQPSSDTKSSPSR